MHVKVSEIFHQEKHCVCSLFFVVFLLLLFLFIFFWGGGGVKCVPIVLCIISEYICVFLKGFRDISVMCIQNITI